MLKLIFSLLFLTLSTTVVSAQQYDLVLEGGPVMDPETGLDATRNVGHPRRKDCPHLVRGTERTACDPCRVQISLATIDGNSCPRRRLLKARGSHKGQISCLM